MNLLAVCHGNQGHKGREHCDTLKKDRKITVSPLNINCEKLVQFDPGGNVYSSNDKIEMELNDILGLNRQHIVEERRLLLDRVRDDIQNTAKKIKIIK